MGAARKQHYSCTNCNKVYYKAQGLCSACKARNTIVLDQAKPDDAASAKRIRRRAKDSERNIAKKMTAVDGPDPNFRNIASSTGRIGHITGMRVDAISRNYVIENKNRKLPSWLILAWQVINQKAIEFNKNALLHIEPSNMPKTFPVQGTTRKLDTMAIIPEQRHEELISSELILDGLVQMIQTKSEYQDLYELYFDLQARGNKAGTK